MKAMPANRRSVDVHVGQNWLWKGELYSNKLSSGGPIQISEFTMVHVLEKDGFLEIQTEVGFDDGIHRLGFILINVREEHFEKLYKIITQTKILSRDLYDKFPLKNDLAHQHVIHLFRRSKNKPLILSLKYNRYQFKIMLSDGRIGWTEKRVYTHLFFRSFEEIDNIRDESFRSP